MGPVLRFFLMDLKYRVPKRWCLWVAWDSIPDSTRPRHDKGHAVAKTSLAELCLARLIWFLTAVVDGNVSGGQLRRVCGSSPGNNSAQPRTPMHCTGPASCA